MKITELNKLLVCCIMLIGGIVLLALGRIEPAIGATMVMSPLAYVFGNGHGILTSNKVNKEGRN